MAAKLNTETTRGYGSVTIWFQNQSDAEDILIHDVELTGCVNVYIPTSGQACGVVIPFQRYIRLMPYGSGLGGDVYKIAILARDPTKPMSLQYKYRVDVQMEKK